MCSDFFILKKKTKVMASGFNSPSGPVIREVESRCTADYDYVAPGLSDNVREQEKLSQLLVDCHWDFTLSARSATGNEIGAPLPE
jgi:hypothetical protein